jgi:hypothetical protein
MESGLYRILDVGGGAETVEDEGGRATPTMIESECGKARQGAVWPGPTIDVLDSIVIMGIVTASTQSSAMGKKINVEAGGKRGARNNRKGGGWLEKACSPGCRVPGLQLWATNPMIFPCSGR